MLKINSLLSLVLIFNINAQETATTLETNSSTQSTEEEIIIIIDEETESNKTVFNEVNSEEANAHTNERDLNSNNFVEVNKLKYEDFLIRYFKNHHHKDKEEIIWFLTDNNYQSIKNNDFEYEKIKPKKLQEMKELIASTKDLEFVIDANIKLGPFDFKNESFELKDITHRDHEFGFESSILKSTLSCDSTKWGLEKFELDKNCELKINKLNKLNFIKVKKDIAEKVTSNFGLDRKVFCKFNLKKLEVINKKFKFFKKTHHSLEASINFESGTCFHDKELSKEAFKI